MADLPRPGRGCSGTIFDGGACGGLDGSGVRPALFPAGRVFGSPPTPRSARGRRPAPRGRARPRLRRTRTVPLVRALRVGHRRVLHAHRGPPLDRRDPPRRGLRRLGERVSGLPRDLPPCGGQRERARAQRLHRAHGRDPGRGRPLGLPAVPPLPSALPPRLGGPARRGARLGRDAAPVLDRAPGTARPRGLPCGRRALDVPRDPPRPAVVPTAFPHRGSARS